jgi:hypothetical protein
LPRHEDYQKEFVILRAQFLKDDLSLFPSSARLGDLTKYMYAVLEDSASHMRRQAVPRRWVITHPSFFDTFRSVLLLGTLGHIKHKPLNVFDYERLEFRTTNQEDAELLRFVFDGKRELLAIQRSSYPDEVVARRFEEFFHLASPDVRRSRLLALYPIPLEDDAVSAIEGKTVRRFVVKIRRPNADLHGVFKPLFEGNDSDEVDLAWWNRAEQLKMKVTGLFKHAIDAVRGGFGEWIAYVRVGKRLQPIRSSTDTVQVHLNTETDESLARDAEAQFVEIPRFEDSTNSEDSGHENTK